MYHIELYSARGAFVSRLSYPDEATRTLAARQVARAYVNSARSWQFTRTEPKPPPVDVYRHGRVTARGD